MPKAKQFSVPFPKPRADARLLFKLVGRNGDTVESICELLAVPQEVEAELWADAQAYPKERKGIEKILRFRQRVAEEFEKLVTAAVSKQRSGRGSARDGPGQPPGPNSVSPQKPNRDLNQSLPRGSELETRRGPAYDFAQR